MQSLDDDSQNAERLFRDNVVANGNALLSYFARRMPRREDAADLVSEVFLIAWRRIGDVPADSEQARKWLYSVARGVLANYRRGEVKRHELAERLRIAISEADVEIDDRFQASQNALAGLSESDRELLMLVHWEGLTLKEAAAILGIRHATARKRAERARVRVAETLRPRLADSSPTTEGRRLSERSPAPG